MSEILFHLEGIGKRFPNGREALCEVSLDIFQGECLVIAGSNGSGKTVLMHILAGLSKPSSGRLFFRAKALPNCLKAIRREVGLVFQDADAQLIGETVAQDIAYGPRERGFSVEETKAVCGAALRDAGLEGKEDCVPATLSGGEKRRLAVAGILATGSRCIIMDEPFANLDWPGIRQVLSIIETLRRAGHSLVILTHELEKVLAHADRLLILDRGRVRDSGRPVEVLDRGVAAWGIRDPRHSYKGVEDCTWLD